MDQIEIVTKGELRKGDIVLMQDSDDAMEENGIIHLLTVDKASGHRIRFVENVVDRTSELRTNVPHMHTPLPGRSIVRIGTRHQEPVLHIDAELEVWNPNDDMEESRLEGFNQGFICAVATLVKAHGHSKEAEDVLMTNFQTVSEMKANGIDEGDIDALKPVVARILQRSPELRRKSRKRKSKARADVPTCRKCGCTEEDCSGCVERTGQACYWVEADLCSACVDVNAEKEIMLNRYFRVNGAYHQFMPPEPPTPDDADWTSRPIDVQVLIGSVGEGMLPKVLEFPSVEKALKYINVLPF